jgi:DNA-binding FadR family transcriptional regulator
VTAGSWRGARDPARLIAALRRDIVYGHLPPGTRIPALEYAQRYRVGPATSSRAVQTLQEEGLVWVHRYREYAAPAGPPASAVAARLGTTLAQLRQAAGRQPASLAAAVRWWNTHDITAAEDGTWQPRGFWQAVDTALGADGTLVKLHDTLYAGPVPAAPDPGPPPAPPPRAPGAPRDPDAEAEAVAALITARLDAGEWAPGTVLPPQHTLVKDHNTQLPVLSLALRYLAGQGQLTPVSLGGTRYVYLVPSPGHPAPAPPQPARTLTAVILLWNDGTRTHHDCTTPPGTSLDVYPGLRQSRLPES